MENTIKNSTNSHILSRILEYFINNSISILINTFNKQTLISLITIRKI